MTDKESTRIDVTSANEDQKRLRNGIIILAIIEALVLISVIVSLMLR